MNKLNLPNLLNTQLKKYCHDENIQVAVASDINKQIEYGEEWLVATDKKLTTFAVNNGTATLLSSHNLVDIKKIETVNLVGSGAVEIEIDGQAHRLIAYSVAKNLDFEWAVEDIRLLLDGQAIEPMREDRVKKICKTCHYPIPEELNKCPRCTEKGKTFRRILVFTRPHQKTLFYIFLSTMAGTLFGLITPYISKLFIDVILKVNPTTGAFENAHLLPLAALALLTAYAIQHLFGGLHFRLSGYLGHKTVYNVRAIVYEKLQELSLAYFDRHQIGALMARVTQDTRELQHFLVDFIPLTLESIFMFIGIGILLLILSWQLTLFVILPIIAMVLFIQKVFLKLRIYSNRYYHRRSRLNALVNDSLSGMRVIKSFGQEDEEIVKFDKKSSGFRDAGIELEKKWSVYFPILQFIIMIGAVMVWFVGGKLVFAGRMTLGSVVAFSGYLMMFYRPVFLITRMLEWISNSLSAAERVFDVIDTEPQIKDVPHPISIPTIEGKIEFREVTFGYNSFKPVIKKLSLEIQSNEIIGLVGKSGAGKSTIINLVCRLYDADKGSLFIDDVDIRKIRYADLRQQIGVVLQDTFLFNGTIFENISYARPDATSEEVIEAAMAANAHDFIIQKPDAYDTEVGERGSHLSGGEKQRIAIARAILRNPRILILDEATSSLDTETEHKIQEALKNLTRGRTTIAIAHRLSTLRNCNRLFVIGDGTLEEVGTHEELMAKKGVFYNLVNMQKKLSKIIAVDG